VALFVVCKLLHHAPPDAAERGRHSAHARRTMSQKFTSSFCAGFKQCRSRQAHENWEGVSLCVKPVICLEKCEVIVAWDM
jgi:hypothetical protein